MSFTTSKKPKCLYQAVRASDFRVVCYLLQSKPNEVNLCDNGDVLIHALRQCSLNVPDDCRIVDVLLGRLSDSKYFKYANVARTISYNLFTSQTVTALDPIISYQLVELLRVAVRICTLTKKHFLIATIFQKALSQRSIPLVKAVLQSGYHWSLLSCLRKHSLEILMVLDVSKPDDFRMLEYLLLESPVLKGTYTKNIISKDVAKRWLTSNRMGTAALLHTYFNQTPSMILYEWCIEDIKQYDVGFLQTYIKMVHLTTLANLLPIETLKSAKLLKFIRNVSQTLFVALVEKHGNNLVLNADQDEFIKWGVFLITYMNLDHIHSQVKRAITLQIMKLIEDGRYDVIENIMNRLSIDSMWKLMNWECWTEFPLSQSQDFQTITYMKTLMGYENPFCNMLIVKLFQEHQFSTAEYFPVMNLLQRSLRLTHKCDPRIFHKLLLWASSPVMNTITDELHCTRISNFSLVILHALLFEDNNSLLKLIEFNECEALQNLIRFHPILLKLAAYSTEVWKLALDFIFDSSLEDNLSKESIVWLFVKLAGNSQCLSWQTRLLNALQRHNSETFASMLQYLLIYNLSYNQSISILSADGNKWLHLFLSRVEVWDDHPQLCLLLRHCKQLFTADNNKLWLQCFTAETGNASHIIHLKHLFSKEETLDIVTSLGMDISNYFNQDYTGRRWLRMLLLLNDHTTEERTKLLRQWSHPMYLESIYRAMKTKDRYTTRKLLHFLPKFMDQSQEGLHPMNAISAWFSISHDDNCEDRRWFLKCQLRIANRLFTTDTIVDMMSCNHYKFSVAALQVLSFDEIRNQLDCVAFNKLVDHSNFGWLRAMLRTERDASRLLLRLQPVQQFIVPNSANLLMGNAKYFLQQTESIDAELDLASWLVESIYNCNPLLLREKPLLKALCYRVLNAFKESNNYNFINVNHSDLLSLVRRLYRLDRMAYVSSQGSLNLMHHFLRQGNSKDALKLIFICPMCFSAFLGGIHETMSNGSFELNMVIDKKLHKFYQRRSENELTYKMMDENYDCEFGLLIFEYMYQHHQDYDSEEWLRNVELLLANKRMCRDIVERVEQPDGLFTVIPQELSNSLVQQIWSNLFACSTELLTRALENTEFPIALIREAAISNSQVDNLIDGSISIQCYYTLIHLLQHHSSNEVELALNNSAILNISRSAIYERIVNDSRCNFDELRRVAASYPVPQVRSIILALCLSMQQVIHDAQPEITLNAIVNNNESSMIELSASENRCIERLKDCYKNVNDVVVGDLEDKYNSNPAQFISSASGLSISLPLQWEEFNGLTLTAEDSARARLAYHNHVIHTAWRFFLLNNQWMSPDAHFVVRDETGNRSNFQQFQALINILYAAAMDITVRGKGGFDSTARVAFFHSSLAQINRAHNWDRSKINDKGKSEEYDDLEGDKPSCNGGIRRRLFQALQDHPMMIILSKDTLRMEIDDYTRAHIEHSLTTNGSTKVQLMEAFEDYLYNMNREALELFNFLEFSAEQQEAFHQLMDTKYDGVYLDDPVLRSFVQTSYFDKPFVDAHGSLLANLLFQ